VSQILTLYTTPVIYLALDRINRRIETTAPPTRRAGRRRRSRRHRRRAVMRQTSHTAHAVTLRCRSAAEASKGDGVSWLSSFEARKGSHLRMTVWLSSSKLAAL